MNCDYNKLAHLLIYRLLDNSLFYKIAKDEKYCDLLESYIAETVSIAEDLLNGIDVESAKRLSEKLQSYNRFFPQ